MAETPDPERAEATTASAPPKRTTRWRGRLALGLGFAVGALASRGLFGAGGGRGTEGVAPILGRAVSGEVAEDGFVWLRGRGTWLDATFGRDVIFAAKVDGRHGPQRDVFRATARVSLEGRVLGVSEVTNLSRTDDADEDALLVRQGAAAFTSRHRGRVTGVTIVDLASECQGCGRLRRAVGAWLARRHPDEDGRFARTAIAFDTPPERIELQWLGDALELRTDRGAARIVPGDATLTVTADSSLTGTAWFTPSIAPTWGRTPSLRARSGFVAARVDGLAVDAPALETRETKTRGGATVTLAAIDTRQLDVHVRGGRRWPNATTGPSANGEPAARDRESLVATLGIHPPRGYDGGFVEWRRVLSEPTGAPALAVDEAGDVKVGRASLASTREPVRELVESDVPADLRGDVGALCRTKDAQLIYAFARDTTRADLDAVLAELCSDAVFFEVGHEPLVTDPNALAHLAPADDSFVYLSRRAFAPPASPGLTFTRTTAGSPEPAWLPAIHHAHLDRRDVAIEWYAIDTTRFDWRVLPGTDEARGHTFDDALEPGEQSRLAFAIGLGSSEPENPRGLVIDGAAAPPFREGHAALLTPARPHAPASPYALPLLTLGLAVDDLVTAGDGVELVLLAEAGVLRSEARELGAPKPRSALCLLDPTTLLYAEGRMDSPEPLVEELVATGCRRVVSSDRGRQNGAFFHRVGVPDAPPIEPSDVTLVGLSKAAGGRVRRLAD